MNATIPAAFVDRLHVSRETLDRLTAYAELLRRWQARINLVSPTTLDQLWERHFLDSAQLYPLLPSGRVADLGSGAGFPGLALAVMGAPDVHLVESDSRKCAFLREAARVCGVAVTIHNRRIEQVAPLGAATVTARALAPVATLLDWAQPHLSPGGVCLFLKGRNVDDELAEAASAWTMRIERFPSLTDPAASILRLSEISRA